MMLLNDKRLAVLRDGLDDDLAPQWRRLYEQCDWYRRQTLPAEHPEASITYFGPAAVNLALAYRLTGHRHYLDEAWRWIECAISFPHWGRAHLPDHDLDAGWLLHGLSLAYSWIGNDLGQEREGRLRAKLELQGTRLFDYAVSTEGRWWSSSYWQNHNWICYAGLATAGYALDHAAWTERTKSNFAQVIEALATDGSDAEGVVYWRYGVIWIATYLDLLQDQEGIDWWHRCEFLANTFSYRLHQMVPGYEENVDHGDCHDRRSGHSIALYRKLAAEYRIGEAQWLADQVAVGFFWREAYESGVKPGVMPEAWAELLWLDRTVAAIDPGDHEPTQAFFPDLGLLASRTSWRDDATLVSFKASPGGGHRAWNESHRIDTERGWETLNVGHHHPDSGAFVLVSHGAFLLVDEGYSSTKMTSHHNGLLVDDHGFAGEGSYHVFKGAPRERTAEMTDVLAEDGFAHGTARLAAMYPAYLGVRQLNRTLVSLPSGRLLLSDHCVSESPRSLSTLLHADWPMETVDERCQVVRSGSGQAWISQLTPVGELSMSITEVSANPTSSTPSLKLTKKLHTRKGTATADIDTEVITAIEPTSALRPDPALAETIEAVAGIAVAFGTKELILLGDDTRRIVAGEVSGRARAVMFSCTPAETMLAVVQATELSIEGSTILISDEPLTGTISWSEQGISGSLAGDARTVASPDLVRAATGVDVASRS